MCTCTISSAPQHTETHCNTLQHTATRAATHTYQVTHLLVHLPYQLCNWLQDTATHCNTLQHIATHCNTLQSIPGHPSPCVSALSAPAPAPIWKAITPVCVRTKCCVCVCKVCVFLRCVLGKICSFRCAPYPILPPPHPPSFSLSLSLSVVCVALMNELSVISELTSHDSQLAMTHNESHATTLTSVARVALMTESWVTSG